MTAVGVYRSSASGRAAVVTVVRRRFASVGRRPTELVSPLTFTNSPAMSPPGHGRRRVSRPSVAARGVLDLSTRGLKSAAA